MIASSTVLAVLVTGIDAALDRRKARAPACAAAASALSAIRPVFATRRRVLTHCENFHIIGKQDRPLERGGQDARHAAPPPLLQWARFE
jgi:hypothetical protein